jgi:aryl-alcohol dehydrogenase-like predicted oxidoreductase
MMIQTAQFGKTGHASSRAIFGAAALGKVSQVEADRTLDVLMEYGVNHIDTAASYGDAELRIGPWMKTYRNEFFLATKTGERTYQKARDEFHRSLERLQTDHVDLIQLHFLIGEDEWQVAMGPGGVLEALVEAREQGLARFIGVTGHELIVPKVHLRSLERFPFDSVLLPYNYVLAQNAEYLADFEKVVAVCRERNVAVQTIKGLTRRPWGDRNRTAATWYEPLKDQDDIDRAVWYVLGRPELFLNTTGDIHVLPKVLDAASRFTERPSDAEMRLMMLREEMEPLFI